MIDFTDGELKFLYLALQKVDPTGIIGEAQEVKRKIEAHVAQLNAEELANLTQASAPAAEEVE